MLLATIIQKSYICAGLLVLAPCVFSQEKFDVVHSTTFPEVTYWTVAKWGAQAAFAPETLKHVIPLYAYKIQDLNSLPYNKDDYMALLPPRNDGVEKPATCGTAFIASSSGYSSFELSDFESLVELTTEIIRQLDQYPNCDANTNVEDINEWYIATSVELKKIDQESEDIIRLWTKSGAWD